VHGGGGWGRNEQNNDSLALACTLIMPKGTKVHRCVQKVKGRKGVNPYAVCSASTGQSYATGKRRKKRKKY